MSKELDTFDKWWMMQSKIPYRDKKEIARSAWEQSRTASLDEVKEVIDEEVRYRYPTQSRGHVDSLKIKNAIDNLRRRDG